MPTPHDKEDPRNLDGESTHSPPPQNSSKNDGDDVDERTGLKGENLKENTARGRLTLYFVFVLFV